MDKISQTINESCFSCQNIGQILIWMILVVSKCSIYDVKHPIFLIFRGPQTPHTATIFEKILQTILFYENKSACHILGTICDTFRIPNALPLSYSSSKAQLKKKCIYSVASILLPFFSDSRVSSSSLEKVL